MGFNLAFKGLRKYLEMLPRELTNYIDFVIRQKYLFLFAVF